MPLVFEPLTVKPDLSPSLIGRPLPGASGRPSRLTFFLPGPAHARSDGKGRPQSRVSTWQPSLSLIAASVTVGGGLGRGSGRGLGGWRAVPGTETQMSRLIFIRSCQKASAAAPRRRGRPPASRLSLSAARFRLRLTFLLDSGILTLFAQHAALFLVCDLPTGCKRVTADLCVVSPQRFKIAL